MAPLLVLIAVTLLARALGLVWTALSSWVEAARVGLAVMLIFTASAHFGARRAGMLQMVPAWVPYPQIVVTLTRAPIQLLFIAVALWVSR